MEIEEEGKKKINTERTHGCVAHVCVVTTGQQKLVSGGARGPPACSGSHRTGSAGPRPREARTRPPPCCLPHLQRGKRCVNENTFSCANGRINLPFSGDLLLVLNNIWEM